MNTAVKEHVRRGGTIVVVIEMRRGVIAGEEIAMIAEMTGDVAAAERVAMVIEVTCDVIAGKGVATFEEENFLMPPYAAALTLKFHAYDNLVIVWQSCILVWI